MRSNADQQSYMKCTMNPEPESWLLDYVSWYLTPDGYADPLKSGIVRWFVSDEDGNLDWADSSDELKVRHGNDCAPMSFTFIFASIADNPILCKLQPGYLTALKNLPRVDREILLYGNWYAVPDASGYFKREWVDFIERKDVPRLKKIIRCWDFASSKESEANPNPDFSASVLMGLGEDGYLYILHATHFRERPAGVLTQVESLANFDGKQTHIGIPLDPGHAGEVAFQTYARPLILNGFTVKKMKTRKGKIERFSPFSNAAENGLVRIVKGAWNKEYYQELERFTGENKREKDDMVDCTSDCYNWLISGKKLPEKFLFNPSSLTKLNIWKNF
jgi:predicted phage terminase large subunit-like protein